MPERAQLDGGLPLRWRLAPTALAVVIVIGAEVAPIAPAAMRQYANTAAFELLVVAALVGIASLVISPVRRIPEEERDE
ncbi:hypothetical protein AFNJKBDN_CDS0009 [Halorubrum virus V_ICIS4]|nr:hypothetical protein AFNJKBDN_CDS0009 [Halorubrum virus V_ICIS4]